jgi:tRNA(adenine34) deaminase
MSRLRCFLLTALILPAALVVAGRPAAGDDPAVAALAARVAALKADPANTHDRYVLACVREAMEACREGNYGVGACLVNAAGEVELYGHNHVFNPYHRGDLHAEMTVLLLAEERDRDDGRRRRDSTLYTSVEPCVMCFARVVGSGVKACWYATDDPPSGMAHLADRMPPSYQGHMKNRTFARCPCSKELADAAAEVYRVSFTRLGKRDHP